jgi:hypothetical protein
MPLAMGGIIGVNLKTQENAMNKGFTREQIERVARIYRCNQDASRALGITIRSFSRLCRKYNVESPFARRRRHLHEFRDGALAAG